MAAIQRSFMAKTDGEDSYSTTQRWGPVTNNGALGGNRGILVVQITVGCNDLLPFAHIRASYTKKGSLLNNSTGLGSPVRESTCNMWLKL